MSNTNTNTNGLVNNFVHKPPKPLKPLGDEIVKITKLSIKMRI